jgi:hypothetical protein
MVPNREVAAILDSKIICNQIYYLVDWLAYGPNGRTWEPATNVLPLLQTLSMLFIAAS